MSIDAQLQIRQNALEVQDYMKDLLEWEKDIKKKESRAHEGNTASSSQQPPVVRGRAAFAAQPAPLELQKPALHAGSGKANDHPPPARAQSSQQSAHAAGHTYSNYRKWDKFDVDAALGSDEEEGAKKPAKQTAKPKPESSKQQPIVLTRPEQQAEEMVERSTVHNAAPSNMKSAPQQPAIPPPRKSAQQPQDAEGWKNRGNDLFKAGEYASAKECYTRSIVCEPTAVGYANRAMASLKLKEYSAAEDDCSQAVLLDPKYVKAYHRRAAARKQLGKLPEACNDFEAALRLEPTHKELQAERDACLETLLRQEKMKIPQIWERIPVQIPAMPTKNAAVGSSSAVAVSSSPAPTSPPAPQAPQAAPAASQPPPSHAAAGNGKAAPTPDAHATSAAEPINDTSGAGPTADVVESLAAKRQRVAAAASAAAEQLSSRAATTASAAPRTSTEFEAAWRGLRGNAAAQVAFVRGLNPSDLPQIFKTSLTPQVLQSLLHTVLTGLSNCAASPDGGVSSSAESIEAPAAMNLLDQLSKVPRFDMNAMCIAAKDKTALKGLWDACETLSGLDAGRLSELRKRYRM